MQYHLLNITLEYCAVCNYTPRAISLTQEILSDRALERYIGSWRLIPGTGSVFEVIVNGELLFSKKMTGRHPLPGEIKEAIANKLDEAKRNQDTLPIVPDRSRLSQNPDDAS